METRFQQFLSAIRAPPEWTYEGSPKSRQQANVEPESWRTWHIEQIRKTMAINAKPSTKGQMYGDLQMPKLGRSSGSKLPQNRCGNQGHRERPISSEPLALPSGSSQITSDGRPAVSPYRSFVVRFLDLRIELRIWPGTDGPPSVIYVSFRGEPPLEEGKRRVRWKCVSALSISLSIS